MAKLKKDTADGKLVVQQEGEDVTLTVDKYSIERVPNDPRLFYIRVTTGGAIPREMEGTFTSAPMAQRAITSYYARRG